jgi:hypothetical protein
MMDGAMGPMMAWMTGFGLLAWVVVIGLLIAILVVLIRLLGRQSASREIQGQGGQEKPLKER